MKNEIKVEMAEQIFDDVLQYEDNFALLGFENQNELLSFFKKAIDSSTKKVGRGIFRIMFLTQDEINAVCNELIPRRIDLVDSELHNYDTNADKAWGRRYIKQCEDFVAKYAQGLVK